MAIHIPAAIVEPISLTANLPSWEVFDGLNDHRFCRFDNDNCSIARFEERWIFLFGLTRAWIKFLFKFNERTRGLRRVAMEDRGVPDGQCTRVLKDDNLSGEFVCNRWWCFCWSTDIATTNISLTDTADVEADVISRYCLGDFFMVHLDGLDFSILIGGHEGDLHSLFHDTGLYPANGNCTNSADAVNILDGQAEWFVGWFVG